MKLTQLSLSSLTVTVLAVLQQVQALGQADVVLSAAVTANQSLLWGSYRPQLYHGVRPRLSHSLMTGLMWFGLSNYQGYTEIRHTCEQSDALSSYTFTKHDGRYFSTQDIVDGKNNVKFVTSFLKTPDGHNWAVRIEGAAINPRKMSRISLIYHLGMEGLGGLDLAEEPDATGLDGAIVLRGSSPALGSFKIRIVDHPETTFIDNGAYSADFRDAIETTAFFGVKLDQGSVWKIKDALFQGIVNAANGVMGKYKQDSPPDPSFLLRLPNQVQNDANVYAFQKNYDAGRKAFGFDVYYESERGQGPWSYDALTHALQEASAAYDRRFAETFPMPEPYDSPEYTKFAQAITSNLIGGIGYYHGASIVDRSFKYDHDEESEDEDDDVGSGVQAPRLEPERELLTATPSRSFFPRGFYWDEGFHLALIGEWDNDLSLEILRDWIALVDDDGWVGREQILGDESRSKVPQEFQTQYPSYANPPTLAMTITSFIHRLKAQNEASLLDSQLGLGSTVIGGDSTSIATRHLTSPVLAKAYLDSIYPALRRHYAWFRRTQRGQIREWSRSATNRAESYRWRGRTADHVLTSGLDDYPRARPPHVGELHVDLMSWMGFFARTMGEIAGYLGKEGDVKEYLKHEKGILANLDDLHWSKDDQMYCDASVDDEDESTFICHKGYLSLFPLFLELVPADSPKLIPIFDLISSPSELWSEYGLRSLSRSHPLYGKDENYWRGPIWIQMNYLVLKALKTKYGRVEGPYKERALEIYGALRKNVIENVAKEYERTGYVWEQYDADSGKGQRSHPFTGWTSLITLIMTEKYQ